jgi:methylmalonyl-CoA mutase C-terminal domain/subunit
MALIRVLIAKVGLDGHDRGAWVVYHGLREAGMEVFYTGLHHSPQQIVKRVEQLQVDVLGISCLSGAHRVYLPQIARGLEELVKSGQLCLLAGGVIPENDHLYLKSCGYEKIFGLGTCLSEIVAYIDAWNQHKKRAKKYFAHSTR